MQTLQDIFDDGQTRSLAGNSPVHNWPQVKASLRLLDQVQPLDQTPIDKVDEALAECARDPRFAPFFKTRQGQRARRDVERAVAALSALGDPWSAIWAAARSLDLLVVEDRLYALRKICREIGISPAEITREWAEEFDDGLGVGWQRAQFRAALAALDELIQIDVSSLQGRVPPCPIGSMPCHTRSGLKRLVLPPRLEAMITKTCNFGALQAVWRAAIMTGHFADGQDPELDDLFDQDVWDCISAIKARDLGISPETWKLYRDRALRVAKPSWYLRQRQPLPPHLARFARSGNRSAIIDLWGRITAMASPALPSAPVEELLRPDVWRLLWADCHRAKPGFLFSYHEKLARFALVDGRAELDPYRVIEASWMALPKPVKSALHPIRNWASSRLYAPLELTPEIIEQSGFSPSQKSQIWDAISAHAAALAAGPQPDPRSPAEVGWGRLRSALRAHGLSVSPTTIIRKLALKDGLGPADLTRGWLEERSNAMSRELRAKFKPDVVALDAMRLDSRFADLLYADPIAFFPNRLKKGLVDIPPHVSAALDDYVAARGLLPNTRKALRSMVANVLTVGLAAGVLGLDDPLPVVLAKAPTLPVSPRHQRDAVHILRFLAPE